jgi:hypothetical protein
MTVLESLKDISGFPVPDSTIESMAIKREINLSDTVTKTIIVSNNYRLVKADILLWVSFAPNINQEGISFDISDSDRESLRKMANAVYKELGDDAYIKENVGYGYKGDRL